MQILGFHIISDAELRKRISEARTEQRKLDAAMITRLLLNAETYRKIAENAIGKKIRLTSSTIQNLLQKSLQKKAKK